MNYDQAKNCTMAFGKHKDQTLDDIASKGDHGLRYLDWLSGQGWVTGTLKIALEIFLDDPATRKELARIWNDKP